MIWIILFIVFLIGIVIFLSWGLSSGSYIGIWGLFITIVSFSGVIVCAIISSSYANPQELLVERAKIEAEMLKEGGTTRAIEERISQYNSELKKTKDLALKQKQNFFLKDFVNMENLEYCYYFNDGKYTNTSPPTN